MNTRPSSISERSIVISTLREQVAILPDFNENNPIGRLDIRERELFLSGLSLETLDLVIELLEKSGTDKLLRIVGNHNALSGEMRKIFLDRINNILTLRKQQRK